MPNLFFRKSKVPVGDVPPEFAWAKVQMDILTWGIIAGLTALSSTALWIGTSISSLNQEKLTKSIKDAAQDEQLEALSTNRDEDRKLLEDIFRKLVVLESKYK